MLVLAVSGASWLFRASLGSLAAYVCGAAVWRSAARVAFWGTLAMGLTAGAGALFGAAL